MTKKSAKRKPVVAWALVHRDGPEAGWLLDKKNPGPIEELEKMSRGYVGSTIRELREVDPAAEAKAKADTRLVRAVMKWRNGRASGGWIDWVQGDEDIFKAIDTYRAALARKGKK